MVLTPLLILFRCIFSCFRCNYIRWVTKLDWCLMRREIVLLYWKKLFVSLLFSEKETDAIGFGSTRATTIKNTNKNVFQPSKTRLIVILSKWKVFSSCILDATMCVWLQEVVITRYFIHPFKNWSQIDLFAYTSHRFVCGSIRRGKHLTHTSMILRVLDIIAPNTIRLSMTN